MITLSGLFLQTKLCAEMLFLMQAGRHINSLDIYLQMPDFSISQVGIELQLNKILVIYTGHLRSEQYFHPLPILLLQYNITTVAIKQWLLVKVTPSM